MNSPESPYDQLRIRANRAITVGALLTIAGIATVLTHNPSPEMSDHTISFSGETKFHLDAVEATGGAAALSGVVLTGIGLGYKRGAKDIFEVNYRKERI